MKIFVVMVDDRHTDTEPYLFTEEGPAVEFARRFALAIARGDVSRIEQYQPQGWVQAFSIGPESDSVWVIEKTVDAEVRR